MEKRPKTVFCDIDGTLVKHENPEITGKPDHKMSVLPGTIEKIMEWERSGYNIILVTGRRESMRSVTEKQLVEAGIVYDQLIMGVGGGERYLINDCKPDGTHYAFAKNPKRNEGISNLNLEE